MDELENLEREPHRSVTKRCRVRLMELLHPAFREIGYSGREHTRESIIENLTDAEPPRIDAEQFRYVELGPETVLVTYRSANASPDGRLSRHSWRSSIWMKEGPQWRMVFHQGTPTESPA